MILSVRNVLMLLVVGVPAAFSGYIVGRAVGHIKGYYAGEAAVMEAVKRAEDAKTQAEAAKAAALDAKLDTERKLADAQKAQEAAAAEVAKKAKVKTCSGPVWSKKSVDTLRKRAASDTDTGKGWFW